MSFVTGGWNNNPNVMHFKAAFRRLITRCGALSADVSGNSTPQEDMELIQASTTTYLPPALGDEETDVFEDQAVPASVSRRMDTILENVLVYISGWVVKKLMGKMSCMTCKAALVLDSTDVASKYGTSYFFLKFKDNGGLVKPSQGVVDVILACEHHMRELTNIHKMSRKITSTLLESRVLAELGRKDIFSLNEHILATQEGIENHHLTLVRLIAQTFFDLRQHHISRLHNASLHVKNIRKKCTKTIIFLGQ